MPITAITLENFRAFSRPTRFELRPITLLVGPNNSGKSSVTKGLTALHVQGDRLLLRTGEQPLETLLNPRSGSQTFRIGFDCSEYNGEISTYFDIRGSTSHYPHDDSYITMIEWRNHSCLGLQMTIIEEFEEYGDYGISIDYFVDLNIDFTSLLKIMNEVAPKWVDTDRQAHFKMECNQYDPLGFITLSGLLDNLPQESDVDEKSSLWRRNFLMDCALPAFFRSLENLKSAYTAQTATTISISASGHRPQRVFTAKGDSPMDQVLFSTDKELSQRLYAIDPGWLKEWMAFLGIGTGIKLDTLEGEAATLRIQRPEWGFTFQHYDMIQHLEHELLTLDLKRGDNPRDLIINSEKGARNERLIKFDWWRDELHDIYSISDTNKKIQELQAQARAVEADRLAGMSEDEIAAERKSEEAMEAQLAALYEARKAAQAEHEKRSLKDGWVHLADLGFGFTRLMPLLIRSNLGAKETYIVEEPEANLHPNLQSKLADLFVDMAGREQRLLVETHSEYLVRKLQYLVATGKAKPEDIVIYYLGPDPTAEDHVREITIDERGALSQPFGPGFFDEATTLMADLFRFQSRN